MSETNHIGIVIVGAGGNRGRDALEILPKLRGEERRKGINLELLCLAEARAELRSQLGVRAAEILGVRCPVVGMLAEAISPALSWLAAGNGQRKVIVYDATPTALHYMHLMTVLPHSERERIYYFGEKPLFTKQGQIEFIDRYFPAETFFCEFIETENPAFQAAKEFIRSEHLKIERMFLWRASCMGVAVAAEDGRAGVQGGALLDKAPHDLSVAIGLVGPKAVEKWCVSRARIHLLAIHADAFLLGRKRFLSIANTPLNDLRSSRIQEELPAEALVSFDVEMNLKGHGPVPASFVASWVGIQDTEPELMLTEKLAKLGIGRRDWLNTRESQGSRNSAIGYDNEEVRVALIEGRVRNRRVHLVVNLLAKFEGRRFVYLINEDGQRETILEEKDGRDYHQSKDDDLARVFTRVIGHCAGVGCAENVGPEASLLVHKIMLRAMSEANEQLRTIEQDAAYKASLEAYGKYLVPVESSR